MTARRPRRGRPFVLCLSLLSAVAAGQATLNVPGTFSDIQSAIAAAAPGDTVLVGPGTWSGPIDFLGKGVRVASSAGAATTFLDGGVATPVVRFQSGESPAAILEGFTLKNGLSALGTPGGGGIYCVGASPTIRDCVVKDCRARDGSSTTNWTAGNGGGAYVSGGAPRFERCRFENNRAGDGSVYDVYHPTDPWVGWPGGSGGGAYVANAARVVFAACAFVGNRAGDGGSGEPSAGGGAGGGMALVGDGWTVVDCVFATNRAGHGGPGEQSYGGGGGAGGGAILSGTGVVLRGAFFGNIGGSSGTGGSGAGTGGLHVAASAGGVALRDVVVDGNSGGWGVFGAGAAGGLFVVGPVVVERCVVRGNWGGGGAVGGVESVPATAGGATPALKDCLVVGNVGGEEGYGQYGAGFAGPGGYVGNGTLEGCTIAGNFPGYLASTPTPGGLVVGGANVLRNCVVWGNAGGSVETWGPTPATVTDSCVEGGYPGTNVVASDPLFVAPGVEDYRLSPGSPCVDAGDPSVVAVAGAPSALCLDGTPRLLDGNLDGVMRVDMGAHEFAHARLTPLKSVAGNGDTLMSVALDGTAGLFAFLAAGAPFDAWLPPYGPLLLDPATAFVLPLGPLPLVAPTYVVPAGSPGWTIDVQALVFDAAGRGNFTNRATIPLP